MIYPYLHLAVWQVSLYHNEIFTSESGFEANIPNIPNVQSAGTDAMNCYFSSVNFNGRTA